MKKQTHWCGRCSHGGLDCYRVVDWSSNHRASFTNTVSYVAQYLSGTLKDHSKVVSTQKNRMPNHWLCAISAYRIVYIRIPPFAVRAGKVQKREAKHKVMFWGTGINAVSLNAGLKVLSSAWEWMGLTLLNTSRKHCFGGGKSLFASDHLG